MSKVIIKQKTVKRPISGEEIGFRLQAAIPNDAGSKYDKTDERGRRVSFAKKYLVAESSDMTSMNERMVDNFLETLRFQGFTEIVML